MDFESFSIIVGSFVRQALPLLSGYLIAHNLATGADMTTLSTALETFGPTVLSLAWSIHLKFPGWVKQFTNSDQVTQLGLHITDIETDLLTLTSRVDALERAAKVPTP